MATAPPKPVSNIAAAFAAESGRADIPKARGNPPATSSGHDKLHQTALLTPPNSLSPTFPARHHRPDQLPALSLHASPPVDSDIDLQDAVEHAAAQDQPTALSRAALSGLEVAGAITPSMLAKHHLPDILLSSGPMAIRHVLNQLAQSVPGFSRIPPAKARRLVVAALESRGGGGPNGEVEFEKVGWGRWDARMKGQGPRDGQAQSMPIGFRGTPHFRMSPPASIPESYAISSVGGLQIPQAGRYKRDFYQGSWAGESILSSREDGEMADMTMAEHEADKMSLDGSEQGSASDASMGEDIPGLEEDLDDVTDHEDWAAIGPDALRQSNDNYQLRYVHRDYNRLSRTSGARLKSPYRSGSASAHSLPVARAASGAPGPAFHTSFASSSSSSSASRTQAGAFNTASSTGVRGTMGQDSQEREAIEALLRMGSM